MSVISLFGCTTPDKEDCRMKNQAITLVVFACLFVSQINLRSNCPWFNLTSWQITVFHLSSLLASLFTVTITLLNHIYPTKDKLTNQQLIYQKKRVKKKKSYAKLTTMRTCWEEGGDPDHGTLNSPHQFQWGFAEGQVRKCSKSMSLLWTKITMRPAETHSNIVALCMVLCKLLSTLLLDSSTAIAYTTSNRRFFSVFLTWWRALLPNYRSNLVLFQEVPGLDHTSILRTSVPRHLHQFDMQHPQILKNLTDPHSLQVWIHKILLDSRHQLKELNKHHQLPVS